MYTRYRFSTAVLLFIFQQRTSQTVLRRAYSKHYNLRRYWKVVAIDGPFPTKESFLSPLIHVNCQNYERPCHIRATLNLTLHQTLVIELLTMWGRATISKPSKREMRTRLQLSQSDFTMYSKRWKKMVLTSSCHGRPMEDHSKFMTSNC